jgi:hypothetical protein
LIELLQHTAPLCPGHSGLDLRDRMLGGRADFRIGTDAFHTPCSIRDALVAAVKQAGYSFTVDPPFAGALVPLASYGKDERVWPANCPPRRYSRHS